MTAKPAKKRQTQTDNALLADKLALRRMYLRRWPAGHVLDCCQGSGELWGRLRSEFQVSSYLPMDLKPKSGRLRLDSARYLARPGWRHDTIDVDTYGEPWEHWRGILEHGRGPTTVFMTCGFVGVRGGMLSSLARSWGLALELPAPVGFNRTLAPMVAPRCLGLAAASGWQIQCCHEAPASPTTRYFAIRLERTS